MYYDTGSTFTLSLFSGHIPFSVIENKTYQALATPVSSLAIKHHVIKQPTILAMAERKLKSL